MSKTSLPKVAAPARRALDAAGVTCLENLARLRREDVAGLHGMGRNAMEALSAALAKQGMAFRR